MNLKQKLELFADVLGDHREVVKVKLRGRILSSTENITGGSGTVEILGTFHQRGLGGHKPGDIVDISFDAINEDDPQGWVMKGPA